MCLAGPQSGGGVPVRGGGWRSFPLWAHLPSPLRSRDTQLLLAVSRSTSMLPVTLCDTVLFQGVGEGVGGHHPHESVMRPWLLVGLLLQHLSPFLAHRKQSTSTESASERVSQL